MHAPLWIALPVIVLVGLATWADVQTRKIPNLLCGIGLLLGIVTHFVLGGLGSAGSAGLGALVAGALLFPGWMMGFMGAGDVKLMAAVGAWLGFPGAWIAVLAALIAGGVISLVVAAVRGALIPVLQSTARLAAAIVAGKATRSERPATSEIRFPFAPAILAGAVFALIWGR